MRKKEVRFDIADITILPIKEYESKFSSDLLKECFDHVKFEQSNHGKGIVIDRNANRSTEIKRELFVTSVRYMASERVWFGRINLIRDGKSPFGLKRESLKMAPIKELQDIDLAETSYFIVDLRKQKPVIAFEMNGDGPRLSDFEFYFRRIGSKEIRKTKGFQTEWHMDRPISAVLSEIRDALSMSVKVEKSKMAFLHRKTSNPFWLKSQELSNINGTQKMRLHCDFKVSGSDSVNTIAVKEQKELLKSMQEDSEVRDSFEEYKLHYESLSSDSVLFDLIKGKKSFEISCPLTKEKNLNRTELFKLAQPKFERYVQSLISK